ncbi:prespore-specific protein [Reticulomyxa filosa]|uniref:Prespore-specific protein n=1 Tax=Reticulomyxa filosa TaxID=46433 RepID=X6N0I5_RETFI|nr:prespore-specific protein [Reticulomyxa filosa]|eukprot:ETO19254.1 prespore-specific protein [Reticulomyxa filosa]
MERTKRQPGKSVATYLHANINVNTNVNTNINTNVNVNATVNDNPDNDNNNNNNINNINNDNNDSNTQHAPSDQANDSSTILPFRLCVWIDKETEEVTQNTDAKEKEHENQNVNVNANANESRKRTKRQKRRPTKKDLGIRPYIQIFKDGKSIWTSRQKAQPLSFFKQSDKSIQIPVQQEIQGDILIRIRHLCSDGRTKISVCRFGKKGYVAIFLNMHLQTGISYRSLYLHFYLCIYIYIYIYIYAFLFFFLGSRFDRDFMIDMVISTNKGESEADNEATQRFSKRFWSEIEKRSLFLEKNRLSTDEKQSESEKTEMIENANLVAEIKQNNSEAISRDLPESETKAPPVVQFVVGTVENEHLHPDSSSGENMEEDNDDEPFTKLEDHHQPREVQPGQTQQPHEIQPGQIQPGQIQSHSAAETYLLATEAPQKEPSKEEVMGLFEAQTDRQEKNGMSELDDLEKFANGLDLDNVQVDSDTEQYFEQLTQTLSSHNTTVRFYLCFMLLI